MKRVVLFIVFFCTMYLATAQRAYRIQRGGYHIERRAYIPFNQHRERTFYRMEWKWNPFSYRYVRIIVWYRQVWNYRQGRWITTRIG